MDDSKSETIKKYWIKVENIFKGYFSNKTTIPCKVVHEECYNIYVHNLSPLLYSKLTKYARSEILRSNLCMNLSGVLDYFKLLKRNIDNFCVDASPLMVEGNRAACSMSLKTRPDFFKHVMYKVQRKKLKSVSNRLSEEISQIILNDRDCRGSPSLVLRGFKLFTYYKLLQPVLSDTTNKLIDVYTKECEDESLEKKTIKIYELLKKESNNEYLIYVFKSLEKRFLARILEKDLDVFFRIKKEKVVRYLAELYIKGHGNEGFFKKIESYSGRHGVCNFMDFHLVINKLDVFRKGLPESPLVQRIDKLMSDIVTENENKIVLDGIDTVANAYLSVDDASQNGPEYNDLLCRAQKLNLNIARVLKFTTKKEDFDAYFRLVISDFLIRNEPRFVKDFVKFSKAIEVTSNYIHKIEVMCEESETRLMTSLGEILYVKSCYWPKYEDFNAKLYDLESIKRKFMKEEKRKNPRIVVKFVDSISLCEIEICKVRSVITVVQYKILDLLTKKKRKVDDLEMSIGFSNFYEHYEPLVKNGLIAEVDGYLSVSTKHLKASYIPKYFTKKDSGCKYKAESGDAEDERRGNILDCMIMRIMKREKKAKEVILCRRIKSRMDFFTSRVNLLVEKAYLVRKNDELIYVP